MHMMHAACVMSEQRTEKNDTMHAKMMIYDDANNTTIYDSYITFIQLRRYRTETERT